VVPSTVTLTAIAKDESTFNEHGFPDEQMTGRARIAIVNHDTAHEPGEIYTDWAHAASVLVLQMIEPWQSSGKPL
jgi:hypothetical protein